MPTVLRIKGYRFYFFAQEGHEPAHVHVDKGSGTMKIWLRDLAIAHTERLKQSEVQEILRLARQHQQFLLRAWHEFERRKG
jgi:Domain of unknown function (DUF4160)